MPSLSFPVKDEHSGRAPLPSGHWGTSPTTSPPSSDFTSPRSHSSVSSAGTSTPVSPLTLSDGRASRVFSHGQAAAFVDGGTRKHSQQPQSQQQCQQQYDAAAARLDSGVASPPIFSSSRTSPPLEPSRLSGQHTGRSHIDRAPSPSLAISSSGSSTPHVQQQEATTGGGGSGEGSAKEKRVSSIRRVRREAASSPLVRPPQQPQHFPFSHSTAPTVVTAAALLPLSPRGLGRLRRPGGRPSVASAS